MKDAPFKPNWASAPGNTILDIIAERKMDPDDFARHMGLGVGALAMLLTGQGKITEEMAGKLSSYFVGTSAQFWINRETQYRESLEYIATLKK